MMRGRTQPNRLVYLAMAALLIAPFAQVQAAVGDTDLDPPNLFAPETPSDPSPAHGAVHVVPPVILSWETSDLDGDTLRSTVYLERDDGSPDDVVCNRTTATTCDPGTLDTNARYFWRVKVEDGKHTVWGPTWRFETVNLPPSVPSNPIPAHQEGNVWRHTHLAWTGGDPDSTGVHYTVTLAAGDVGPFQLVCSGTAPNCDPGTLEPETTYRWRVDARDEDSVVVGPEWTFTTDENHWPSPASGPSPSNGSQGHASSESLAWQGGDPDGDPVTYTVFLDPVGTAAELVVCTTTSLACAVDALASGTTYSWRVDTDDGLVTTRGPVWVFDTRANEAPVITPLDVVPGQDALAWTAADADGDPLTYRVDFARGDDALAPLCDGITVPSCTLPALTDGTKYRWRVTATDAYGPHEGTVEGFKTPENPIPDTPTGPTPEHRARGVPRAATVTWTAADPAGEPLRHTVLAGQGDHVDLQPVTGCIGLTTTQCTMNDLAYGTNVYWRVMVDDGTHTVTGPTWTFKTLHNSAPGAPSGAVPGNEALNVPVSQHLAWTGGDANGDPVTYTVHLDAWDATPETTVPGCVGITLTTCDPGTLASGTRYHWRVDADDGFETTRGPTWTFTTPWDGIGSSMAWGFDADDGFEKVNDQQFSEILRNPLTANVLMRSDGRDAGNEEYRRELPTALGRDRSFRADVDIVWNDAGENQPANLLVLSAPGDLDTDANPFAFQWAHASTPGGSETELTTPTPGKGEMKGGTPGMGKAMPAFGTTFVPEPGDAYRFTLEYAAETRVLTKRLVHVATGVEQASSTGVVEPPAEPMTLIGFASEGRSLPPTAIGGAQEVVLDNARIRWSAPAASFLPAGTVPADGASGVPAASAVLRWDDGSGVLAHRVLMDTANPPTATACATAIASCDPGILLEGTTYHWRVEAADGSGSPGPVWTFTTARTNQPPTVPGDLFPAAGATDIGIGTVLSWSGGDGDGDAVMHDVFVDTVNPPRILECRTVTTTCDPGLLAFGTTYYWQVVTTDVHGGVTPGPVIPMASVGLPGITYYHDCGSATALGGAPHSSCGWDFSTNLNLVSLIGDELRFTVDIDSNAYRSGERRIGVGYNGNNVGIVARQYSSDSYRFDVAIKGIDFLSGESSGCRTTITFTPRVVSGRAYDIRYSNGGGFDSWDPIYVEADLASPLTSGYSKTIKATWSLCADGEQRATYRVIVEQLSGFSRIPLIRVDDTKVKDITGIPSTIDVEWTTPAAGTEGILDIDLSSAGADGSIVLDGGSIAVIDLFRYTTLRYTVNAAGTIDTMNLVGSTSTSRGTDVRYVAAGSGSDLTIVDVDRLSYVDIDVNLLTEVFDAYGTFRSSGRLGAYASFGRATGGSTVITGTYGETLATNLKDVDLVVNTATGDIDLTANFHSWNGGLSLEIQSKKNANDVDWRITAVASSLDTLQVDLKSAEDIEINKVYYRSGNPGATVVTFIQEGTGTLTVNGIPAGYSITGKIDRDSFGTMQSVEANAPVGVGEVKWLGTRGGTGSELKEVRLTNGKYVKTRFVGTDLYVDDVKFLTEQGTVYVENYGVGGVVSGGRETYTDTISGSKLTRAQFWNRVADPQIRMAATMKSGYKLSLTHKELTPGNGVQEFGIARYCNEPWPDTGTYMAIFESWDDDCIGSSACSTVHYSTYGWGSANVKLCSGKWE